MLHVLRDCPTAREVWRLHGWDDAFFQEENVFAWIKNNVLGPRCSEDDEHQLLFLSSLWLLWRARNSFVFQHRHQQPYQIARKAMILARDTQLAFEHLTSASIVREIRWVRWYPPDEELLKLNSDGSLADNGHAAAGGVVRDSAGAWVMGYSINIGTTTVFNAELWGLYVGLKRCLDLGFTRIHIELDSSSLVQTLNSGLHDFSNASHLLRDCFRLLQLLDSYIIGHTLREGNAAADFMAELGHHIDPGPSYYDRPPNGLGPILLSDSMGVMFPRM